MAPPAMLRQQTPFPSQSALVVQLNGTPLHVLLLGMQAKPSPTQQTSVLASHV